MGIPTFMAMFLTMMALLAWPVVCVPWPRLATSLYIASIWSYVDAPKFSPDLPLSPLAPRSSHSSAAVDFYPDGIVGNSTDPCVLQCDLTPVGIPEMVRFSQRHKNFGRGEEAAFRNCAGLDDNTDHLIPVPYRFCNNKPLLDNLCCHKDGTCNKPCLRSTAVPHEAAGTETPGEPASEESSLVGLVKRFGSRFGQGILVPLLSLSAFLSKLFWVTLYFPVQLWEFVMNTTMPLIAVLIMLCILVAGNVYLLWRIAVLEDAAAHGPDSPPYGPDAPSPVLGSAAASHGSEESGHGDGNVSPAIAHDANPSNADASEAAVPRQSQNLGGHSEEHLQPDSQDKDTSATTQSFSNQGSDIVSQTPGSRSESLSGNDGSGHQSYRVTPKQAAKRASVATPNRFSILDSAGDSSSEDDGSSIAVPDEEEPSSRRSNSPSADDECPPSSPTPANESTPQPKDSDAWTTVGKKVPRKAQPPKETPPSSSGSALGNSKDTNPLAKDSRGKSDKGKAPAQHQTPRGKDNNGNSQTSGPNVPTPPSDARNAFQRFVEDDPLAPLRRRRPPRRRMD